MKIESYNNYNRKQQNQYQFGNGNAYGNDNGNRNGNETRKVIFCHFCKKRYHVLKDCRKLKAYYDKNKANSIQENKDYRDDSDELILSVCETNNEPTQKKTFYQYVKRKLRMHSKFNQAKAIGHPSQVNGH